MSGGWVAGSVRARLLAAERTLGAGEARRLADSATLRDALIALGRTPYRRHVTLRLDLADAQRAVAAKTLADLRLLAGWLPGDALGVLRDLAAWYELANIEDRLGYLAGGRLREPFELGSLAVAWPRAESIQTIDELRSVLAASSWGDPGGSTAAEIGLGLRLAWARRAAAAPEARPWAAGAAALLVARELFVVGTPAIPPAALLGPAWQAAPTFARFAGDLPADAAWALVGCEGPDVLWTAEARWWTRVEADARRLAAVAAVGPGVVVAAVALLGVDAHRVSSALALAARRSLAGAAEVFDAAA